MFYTVALLKAVKAAHEAWVQSQGEALTEVRPVQVAAQPAGAPALTLALNVQMSDEALLYCALALVIAFAVPMMVYQARAA